MDDAGGRAERDAGDAARVQCQPEAERGEEDALTEGVARGDDHLAAGRGLHVAAEGEPAELGVVRDISPGVAGVAEEGDAVVRRVRVEIQMRRVRC